MIMVIVRIDDADGAADAGFADEDEFEEEDEAVWNETIQWMSTGKDTETAWNSNMQHCRVFPTIASKKWNVPPNKRFVTTTE